MPASVKQSWTSATRFWWRGSRSGTIKANDASGSAAAGNGRDSTGPEAAWTRESRIRAPRGPPPR